MNQIIILHADIPEDAPEDEKDVFQQVKSVSDAITEMGFKPVTLPISLNLEEARENIEKIRPKAIFNLVESLAGTGRFIYLAPALLEFLKIPFSGAGSETMILTTNKILTKERLKAADIATPDWLIQPENIAEIQFDPPYIVKPVNEDASIGLDETSFVFTRDKAIELLKMKGNTYGTCFIEKYIEGREFNISILADSTDPIVLPPAEIKFVDFPDNKPHIVGYRAKWETDSFEYRNTIRTFDIDKEDKSLIKKLSKISLDCWYLFRLHGYARVDFRVDSAGHLWVLEINANPCISPDSGFIAAANQAGLNYTEVICRILSDVPGLKLKV